MNIRYLNAIGGITEEEAVAESMDGGYYVQRGTVLCKVDKDLIVSEFHKDSKDFPPGVLEYVRGYKGELTLGEETRVGSKEVN